jgi:parallel beta-helix repeat protein
MATGAGAYYLSARPDPSPAESHATGISAAAVVTTKIVVTHDRLRNLVPTPRPSVTDSRTDTSGTSIPDTDYAIPAGAVFMSPNGLDRNNGKQNTPVRSLARAIALAPAAGTIVLRAGVYRDGSAASITKKLTFQAYPHEQVWLDGTDVVTDWKRAGGGLWYTDWSTPGFCAGQYYSRPFGDQRSDNSGPCTHVDMSRDPADPAAGDPQMVFVDGTNLHEVTGRSRVTDGTFAYDQGARRLYLGSDPAGHTVALTARASALVFQGGPGGDIVRGIGFRRFATNEFNGNVTHGAVLFNSPFGTVDKTVFTRNSGGGLSFADSQGASVRSSVFAKNGFNGLDANGTHVGSGVVDDMDVEGNVFNGNNTEHFGTGCSISCAAAGSKMAHMVGLTLKDNIFENNVGKGFWCDLYCTNATIVENVFRNNTGGGLMYEVSHGGVIASNLMYGNGGYGFKGGSGDIKFYNNTLAGNQNNILMYDDSRQPSGSEVAPNTTNINMANNVLYGGANTDFQNLKGQTAANQLYSTLDYDSFIRPKGGPSLVQWYASTATTSFMSLTGFRDATGYEAHGQDLVTDAPVFVDAAGDDYRIRGGSAAKEPGRALPAAVAGALGLPAGTVPDRGAINWPGRP